MQKAIVEYSDALTLSNTLLGALERKELPNCCTVGHRKICGEFHEEPPDLLTKELSVLDQMQIRAAAGCVSRMGTRYSEINIFGKHILNASYRRCSCQDHAAEFHAYASAPKGSTPSSALPGETAAARAGGYLLRDA